MRHPYASDSHDPSTATCTWFVEDEDRWDGSGCEVVESESTATHTTCQCSHLTSFAVLMDVSQRRSPAGENDESGQSTGGSEGLSNADSERLSMITLVGCSISIVCLIITVVAYAVFPRARTFSKLVLQHLSLTLLLSMVAFVGSTT